MTQNNVNTAIDGYSDFLKITEERGYALYRAYDEAHHRQVVLRVFKRNLHDEQTLRQACADELRALMRLIHPNIVSTVGYGLWRHNLYAVNVQTQGLSLQQWVREERLQWVDKYQIAIELLRAMQHAHRNQIIHGDIHATHVIVDTKKKPHLTGFCLHALCDQLEDSVNLVGGDRYVYWAPERRDDARLFTRATDVYALGVLFYFLFMGDLPSDGDVLDVLLLQIGSLDMTKVSS
ncbi:MAG: protein kinase, partial [Gammaproteobacteria bacterium]